MSITALSSNSLQGSSMSGCKSVLSDQIYALPIDISCTFSVNSGNVMFGVAAAGSTSNNNWTVANSYGFYFTGANSLTKNVNALANTAGGLNACTDS